MKSAENLKEGTLDQQIEDRLRDLLRRIPFMKLKSFRRTSENLDNQADWVLKVEIGGRPWVLLVEGKRHGQPREIRNGLLQLERIRSQTQEASRKGNGKRAI